MKTNTLLIKTGELGQFRQLIFFNISHLTIHIVYKIKKIYILNSVVFF